MSKCALHHSPWSLGQYHSYNLSQLPWEYTAHYAQPLGATGLLKHNNPLYPLQVPIYTPGWREAITVKCLAQGHKYHGCSQDSNPHSDDSAIRTQIRCTKPLGRGTPWLSRISKNRLYISEMHKRHPGCNYIKCML